MLYGKQLVFHLLTELSQEGKMIQSWIWTRKNWTLNEEAKKKNEWDKTRVINARKYEEHHTFVISTSCLRPRSFCTTPWISAASFSLALIGVKIMGVSPQTLICARDPWHLFKSIYLSWKTNIMNTSTWNVNFYEHKLILNNNEKNTEILM